MRVALLLTEKNLGSLIAACHADARLMTPWRDFVSKELQADAAETPASALDRYEEALQEIAQKHEWNNAGIIAAKALGIGDV